MRQGGKMTKSGSLLKVMRCPRVSKLPHTLTQENPTARVKWMQCKNVKSRQKGEKHQSVSWKRHIGAGLEKKIQNAQNRRKGTCSSKLFYFYQNIQII